MTKKCFVGLVGVVLTTAGTQAQELTFGGPVTAGTVTVEISPLGAQAWISSYDISGPGFHIVAGPTDTGVTDAQCEGTPTGECRSGDVVNLSSRFHNTAQGIGMATVNGQTLSPAYMSGGFELRAGNVTLPQGNRKHVVLSAPFTFDFENGDPVPIWIWTDSPSSETLWARGHVTGTGTATIFFERFRFQKEWRYAPRRIVYSFHAL